MSRSAELLLAAAGQGAILTGQRGPNRQCLSSGDRIPVQAPWYPVTATQALAVWSPLARQNGALTGRRQQQLGRSGHAVKAERSLNAAPLGGSMPQKGSIA